MEITFKYTKIDKILHISANNYSFDVPSWEAEKACKRLGIAILDEKEHTHTVSEKIWDDWMRGY
jgi:hypothetical protein